MPRHKRFSKQSCLKERPQVYSKVSDSSVTADDMITKDRLSASSISWLWHRFSRYNTRTLWRFAGLLLPFYRALAHRERRVTRDNLARAFPMLDMKQRGRLARLSLQHSIATALELGFAWQGHADDVSTSIVDIEGLPLLEEAQAEHKGVIVLAPHFGNWEVLNFWLSSNMPFTAMYEPPRLQQLDDVIRSGRERMGAHLVPTTSRGVSALLKALKRGEAIGILPDQVPDDTGGVIAPFYGYPAYTATLLPKLVSRTGARVIVSVARRLPDGSGYVLHFLPADTRVYSSDEAESAYGVNASVERVIALDPAQYQWEYKRYKHTSHLYCGGMLTHPIEGCYASVDASIRP